MKNWTNTTLSDVTTKIGDGLHGTPDYSESGEYFFINGSNLKHGKISIDTNTKKISHTEYEKIKKDLNNRTILLAINGTLGNVGLYQGEKVALGKSACYLNIKNDVSLSFIRYVLESSDFQQFAIKFATGATIKNLSLRTIREYEFLLPPTSVQSRISKILSCYDDLIQNNIHRIQILEEMAQRLYEEWFVHFRFPGFEKVKMVDSELGKIPEGWRVCTVEKIIKRVPVGKKYSSKNALLVGHVPILDQGQSGIIGFHNENPGVYATYDTPVIVFANHTCYQRIINYSFSAIQNVLPFVPVDNNIDIYWLHWATKGLVQLNDYKGHWPEFIQKRIILPRNELQMAFSNIVSGLFQQVTTLENINKKLTQTRDLLLPRLISGEIEV